MRFNVINYLMGEGIKNLFKNKKSTMSSLMTMCATMLIFGLFFVIGENINAFVANVAEAQEIRVIIKNEATEEQIEEIGKELYEIEGVRNVEFISKEAAFEYMKEQMGEELLEGREEIFPVSYDVTLTDLEMNEEVQESIMQLENIKEIKSANQVISQIINLANGVRIVTAGILILLIVISVGIISNTIKLTVYARRKEISIMKYVGATNSFIRWPFLVEGIVIGIIAGLISIALIWGVYTFLADWLATTSFLEMANWKLLEFKNMFNIILIVYLGLGMGIGVLGSGLSMRKYLDV